MLRRAFMGCVLGLGLALAEVYAPHKPWKVEVPRQRATCVFIGKGVFGDGQDPRNWLNGRMPVNGDDVVVAAGHWDWKSPELVPSLESVTVVDGASCGYCKKPYWDRAGVTWPEIAGLTD